MILAVVIGFLFGFRFLQPELFYSNDEITEFTQATKDACGKGLVITIGGGFDYEDTFKPLLNRCMKHVGKENPNMLFIATGAREDPGEDNLARMDWFAHAGCNTDRLNVVESTAEECAEKVSWADIIYETGGNLKFLTEAWGEKGMFEDIRAAFASGTALIGPSTGAMCWAYCGFDNCGDDVFRFIEDFPFIGYGPEFHYYYASDVVPFCVIPHFDNIGYRQNAFKAVKSDVPWLCIENGAAVAFENGKFEVISDQRTPFRTAYVFCTERNIVMAEIKHSDLAEVVAGEFLTKRSADR